MQDANESASNIKKRILFISVVLGLMFGVGLFLIIKVIDQGNFILLAVLLPLLLTSIPMVATLLRLRRATRGRSNP